MHLPAAAVLRYVSWACPGRTDTKFQKNSSKDNPRVQAWMTTVSQFIFFRSKTDLVYRHEWLCRSGNGHGGSILTPQAENKNCQSVGTCSTWKMQSWLENTSVALQCGQSSCTGMDDYCVAIHFFSFKDRPRAQA